MAKRVLMLGMDALLATLVEKFVDEGIMPNFSRLMEGGCFTRLLSSIPAQTPANWHTVATGATPGRHSVTIWGSHRPDDPAMECHRPEAFNAGLCRAEYVWEAAARAGIKSVVMNYAGYPPTAEGVTQIDRLYQPVRSYYDVCAPTVYNTTVGWPGYGVELTPAEGWRGLPDSARPPLEVELPAPPSSEGAEVVYHGLLIAAGQGYDTLLICTKRDAAAALTTLKAGQWSDWLRAEFETQEMGRVEAALRFKLIECSPDASAFRLYRSEAYPTDGRFVSDPALGRLLVERLGPYVHCMNSLGMHMHGGLLDWQTADRLLAEESAWWAGAARLAMDETGAALFYLHWHLPDHLGHCYMDWIDPAGSGYTPERAEKAWPITRDYYRAMDRWLGEFVARFDPAECAIAVVAEHGMPANKRAVSLVNAFREKGWLTLADDGKSVDWAASKLFYDQNHLWINLKGREPTGVVPPTEYVALRAEVQALMRDIKDPQTGEHVLSFVLTREEAPVVGLYGECVGDLAFCYAGGYRWSSDEVLRMGEERVVFPSGGGNHGPMIPTYETEVGTVYGMLVLAGPGVRKGLREAPGEKGCRRTVDVAPTLAHLLGIGPPAQSEGRVLHEFLEGFESAAPARTLTPTERPLVRRMPAPRKVQLKGDVTDEEP